MKITKEQFLRIVESTENKDVPASIMLMTAYLAHKHVSKGRWRHGNPVLLFMHDDMPCIQYWDDQWWHYDLVKGTWY